MDRDQRFTRSSFRRKFTVVLGTLKNTGAAGRSGTVDTVASNGDAVGSDASDAAGADVTG
jgi:hypothetical protein